MMWYENENGCDLRPQEVDTTTGRTYVYLRRSIERVPESDGAPAHYRWEEMKIPREMWGMCRSVIGHEEALDDVYAALTELAEIIAEV